MAEEQKDPVYEKLLSIREDNDLTLKNNSFMKESFIDGYGEERKIVARPYQRQAILHLLCMDRFVLGDDCGLGKTFTSIKALTYLWERDPNMKVLVLTTKSAIPQWKSEFEKFTKGITALICTGTKKKRRKIYDKYLNNEGPTVLISGYRSMVNDIDIVQHWKDFVFITDEATAYKNPKTQTHKTCYHLSKNARKTWALTATLIKNNLMEGYGIYRVVVPGLFATKNKFILKYCVVKYQRIRGGRKIPIVVGHKKEHIENFRNKIDKFFLGRAKIEVAKELPTLTSRVVNFPLNTSESRKYSEALDGLLTIGEATGEEEEIEVDKLTSLIRCQQIVNHLKLLDCKGKSSKMNTLIELLTEGDLSDEKVIVFSRFKELVNIGMPLLEEKKRKKTGNKNPDNPFCVRVTGDDSSEERDRAKRLFLDPKSGTQVIWITMAGSDAINLQSAKAVVFYDSPWSAGDYIQILGRMIRVGSTESKVYAIHLVAQDTIDERVMQVLKKKMKLVEAIIGERIKKEGSQQEEFTIVNELNEIFDMVKSDAKKKRKRK